MTSSLPSWKPVVPRLITTLLCLGYVCIASDGSSAPNQYQAFPEPPDNEDSVEEYLNMSLEELLNVKVVTGSKRLEKNSDTPAVITVYTARDLGLTFMTRWVDAYRVADESVPQPDGHSMLDAHLTYNYSPSTRISLMGRNLTGEDAKYPKGGLADVPLPGRNLSLTVASRF